MAAAGTTNLTALDNYVKLDGLKALLASGDIVLIKASYILELHCREDANATPAGPAKACDC